VAAEFHLLFQSTHALPQALYNGHYDSVCKVR
jgi:hypothetical protein